MSRRPRWVASAMTGRAGRMCWKVAAGAEQGVHRRLPSGRRRWRGQGRAGQTLTDRIFHGVLGMDAFDLGQDLARFRADELDFEFDLHLRRCMNSL